MSVLRNIIILFSIICSLCPLTTLSNSTSNSILPSGTIQAANYTSTPTTITNKDGTTTKTIDPGPALANMSNKYIVSYPASQITKQDDGSYLYEQVFTNRQTQQQLPSGYTSSLRGGNFSFLALQGDHTAPSGSSLFQAPASTTSSSVTTQDLDTSSTTSLSTIQSNFDSLMQTISSNTAFVKFFRKVHLNILNELYEYLINIYTNFNLHHPGSTLNSDGSLAVNIPNYISAEETYAMNIKTLIINHLVNLIEEQFYGSVTAIMPNVPELFATKIGKTTILSDYSTDITNFILTDIESDLQGLKSTYLSALKQYLSFFKNYTNLISIEDDSTGFSQFCSVAENINTIINTTDPASAVATMNPQMFFYDVNTMRALRCIPDLAKKLPSNTQSVGWSSTMTTAASQKYIVTTSGSSHPIAYFTNNDGAIVTSEAQAEHLYVIIESGSQFFQEEALKQPDWLNNEEGILNILRACLGDFTALLGMGVLDCCMETLINNALNITSTSSSNISTTCKTLINSWGNDIVTSGSESKTTTEAPTTISTPSSSIIS